MSARTKATALAEQRKRQQLEQKNDTAVVVTPSTNTVLVINDNDSSGGGINLRIPKKSRADMRKSSSVPPGVKNNSTISSFVPSMFPMVEDRTQLVPGPMDISACPTVGVQNNIVSNMTGSHVPMVGCDLNFGAQASAVNFAVNQHSLQVPFGQQQHMQPLALKTPVRMKYSSGLTNYPKCRDDQRLAYEQLVERQLRAKHDEYMVLMTKKKADFRRKRKAMENNIRAQQMVNAQHWQQQQSVPGRNRYLGGFNNGLLSQIPLATNQQFNHLPSTFGQLQEISLNLNAGALNPPLVNNV